MVQLLQIGKLINMAGQGGFSGGGPGDPAEIAVNAVDFDGTNDYLLRGAGYTGAADGDKGSLALWVKFNGGDGSSQLIFTNDRFFFNREVDGTIRLILKNAADEMLALVYSDFTVQVADGWTCLLVSWDLGSTPVAQIYDGDVAATLTVTTLIEGTIDYTVANHSVGASTGGANKLNGCMAQAYLNFSKFIDFSVESNRRKFFSSGGNPVDLGADGSRPTGIAPILFLSGATVSWHTNKGSGGGMTETGALTDCATDPSDFPVIFTAAFVAAFV